MWNLMYFLKYFIITINEILYAAVHKCIVVQIWFWEMCVCVELFSARLQNAGQRTGSILCGLKMQMNFH